MPWYRTRSGQLVHAVGELARSHVARGAVQVDDPDEQTLDEAQESADAAGVAAAEVDAATRAAEQKPPAPAGPPPTVPEPTVVFDSTVRPPMSAEDEARVDRALADETPHRGLLGRRKPKDDQ